MIRKVLWSEDSNLKIIKFFGLLTFLLNSTFSHATQLTEDQIRNWATQQNEQRDKNDYPRVLMDIKCIYGSFLSINGVAVIDKLISSNRYQFVVSRNTDNQVKLIGWYEGESGKRSKIKLSGNHDKGNEFRLSGTWGRYDRCKGTATITKFEEI